ncbi:hypothetical protein [Nitrosarchaeum sp. AC2]|uniref:hypothetical protein n=1 Tax=Nitrosarchaeum sp. AC2 TaxID=2259673 RepID=UPI0015CBD86D|nr:hypothetical protein [Nitrosarchaeum sp. AC2]QLH11252.1 hypothetical protein DSQ20_07110 [Nitrosarchaeum sp. AC2]
MPRYERKHVQDLDILAREIGNPMSINEIKNKTNHFYGSADYKNIHTSIHEMAESELIRIEKIGKSSIAVLNFDNSLLIDSLAQVELIKKVRFLEGRKDWQILVLQIIGYLKDMPAISSIITVRPEKHAKLNRLELFILLRDTQSSPSKDIEKTMYLLQRVHNIHIDYLLISEESFENFIRYDDANPIKEIMYDKIVLFSPQAFWLMIKNILDKGMKIQVDEKPISLTKISDQDIVFNLARFGYKEMGTKVIQSRAIGIEYVVTAILVKKDNIRRLEAIPIILAKNNEKVNYSLLVFLASKFKVIQQLYNILKVLNELKPTKEVQQIMKEISNAMVQKVKTDQNAIELSLKDMEKKMRLYNVIE